MTSSNGHHAGTVSILHRCVCLTLACHFLGNHRKVDVDDLVKAAGRERRPEPGTLAEGEDGGVDVEQFGATKKLLPPKVLRPAMRVLGAAKSYLRSEAISAHRVFGERSYLVPVASLQRVHDRLVELQGELAAAVEVLVSGYADEVQRQRAALGPLWKASDYLTPDQVRAAWALEFDWVSFGTPDHLVHVSQAVYEQSKRREEERWRKAGDEVVLTLMAGLQAVLDELVAKVQPGADGQPRRFKRTALDPLLQFLETFERRNLTGHDELARVVGRIRRATRGVDADALKDFAEVRERVVAQVRREAAALDAMVVSHRRAMTL